jgi:hypothetical protein
MIVMIHEYVSFLARWKISPKQFLLVYLLYLTEYERRPGRKIYSRPAFRKKDVRSSLYHYAEWTRTLDEDTERVIRARFTTGNVQYLVDQGILHPDTNVRGTDLDSLRLSPDFIDTLFINTADFEEFWDMYPGFKRTEGKTLSLKVIDKDEFENIYFERIINKDLHRRVVDALRWAKKKDLVNMSVENFLKAEMWKQFEKEMAKETESKAKEGFLV